MSADGDMAQDVREHVVAPVAASVSARSAELADLMIAGFRSETPELMRDDETVEAGRAATQASIRAIARALEEGADLATLELPPEVNAFTRESARQRLPLPVLLRTFRLGQVGLWRVLLAELTARARSVEQLGVATDLASATLFAFIDIALLQVEEAYVREREQFARSSAAVRAETIARILDGTLTAPAVVGQQLRHDLDRTHVGLWAWLDRAPESGDPYQLLEAALTEFARVAGLREPLVQPMGTYAVAGWISVAEPPDIEALAARHFASEDFPGVRLAVGEPADGVAGFRATHAQASDARRVATLARMPAGSVTRYANVALQALACGDVEHVRTFVQRELGPLAANDDVAVRLASTLDVYLDEHASRSRAANRLGVHDNTVSYRLKQVEEILGRSVEDHTLNLRVALALAPLVRERDEGWTVPGTLAT